MLYQLSYIPTPEGAGSPNGRWMWWHLQWGWSSQRSFWQRGAGLFPGSWWGLDGHPTWWRHTQAQGGRAPCSSTSTHFWKPYICSFEMSVTRSIISVSIWGECWMSLEAAHFLPHWKKSPVCLILRYHLKSYACIILRCHLKSHTCISLRWVSFEKAAFGILSWVSLEKLHVCNFEVLLEAAYMYGHTWEPYVMCVNLKWVYTIGILSECALGSAKQKQEKKPPKKQKKTNNSSKKHENVVLGFRCRLDEVSASHMMSLTHSGWFQSLLGREVKLWRLTSECSRNNSTLF